jgi:type IV pilus assembly protein PilM
MGILRRKPKQTVVVDLSRGTLKMAAAESAGEAVRFLGMTSIPLPVAEDAEVRIDDPELVELIRQVVKDHGWEKLPAACLLSRSVTSTQSFVFPQMPDSELRQAIELKLHETLHFGVEEASFGFRRIQEYEDDDGVEVLTLVAAAQLDAVQGALDLLRGAGLVPIAVSAAAESLANLAHHARLCDPEQLTIHVDMSDDSTILNLFEGRLLRFSREIDIANSTFTRALTRPVARASGELLQLTPQQAEEIKRTCGVSKEPVSPSMGISTEELQTLLEPVVRRLSIEIGRSVDYMRNLIGGGSLDKIVLTGPGSAIRELDLVLQTDLGIPVVSMDPVSRATAHWRLSVVGEQTCDTAGFSAILGYSIGDQQPIDLISREERINLLNNRMKRLRNAASAPLLAVAIGVSMAGVPVEASYVAATDSMRWTLDELSAQHSSEQRATALLDITLRKSRRVIAARGPVPNWTAVMKELSVTLPDPVQVDSMRVSWKDGSQVLALTTKVHEDESRFDVIVQQVTSGLSLSPFFADVHVTSAQADISGSEGILGLTVRLVAPLDEPWTQTP